MTTDNEFDAQIERRQAADDAYYAPTEVVVYVPVKVRIHYATGVVYSFDAPTTIQVEKAVESNYMSKLVLSCKEVIKSLIFKTDKELNSMMDVLQEIHDKQEGL